MSKTTYPVFGDMLPKKQDIQLIVDSFKEEDRKRLTTDGVFNPGIVNEVDEYLRQGTNPNTLKIMPFVAYTKSGNRIEVSNIYDFLTISSEGQEIIIDDTNIVEEEKDVPYWRHYQKVYTNFAEATTQTYKLLLTNLKPGAILQGVKLKHIQQFNGCGTVYVSIGTETEPLKYTPQFLISDIPTEDNIETSNILYSESSTNETPVYAHFTCTQNTLNSLISGSLDISLCIANVSNADYDDEEVEGGIPLVNTIGSWKPNMTYYIVARYTTQKSDLRSINIHNDEIDIDTVPFYSRETDDFKFYALRRTGAIIDPITDNDVKLGRVVSDSNGDITIYVNIYNSTTKTFDTDYLTLPGARFRDFAYTDIEEYIKNKVNKTGDTMSGALTFTNGNKITLVGANTYNINSANGSEQLNILSNVGRGLIMAGTNDTLYYYDGENRYKILNENDNVANQDLSNLSNAGEAKIVLKSGDSMTGALYVPSPADDDNSTRVATTSWVRKFILESGIMLGRMDYSNAIPNIDISNGYTILSNGYIIGSNLSGSGSGAISVFLQINNTIVGGINGANTATYSSERVLPVSAGDFISIGTAGTVPTKRGSITFVPQKQDNV